MNPALRCVCQVARTNPIRTKKRAGQHIIRLCYSKIGNDYGAALVFAGAVGAAFVVVDGGVVPLSSDGLQPETTALKARPNSTTKDSFFIGRRNFYWFAEKHK